ncbi:MAG: hypothetical protein OES15_04365 [Nitrosopumilus sp.]|jgi:hypothetical protein|nr:hypothetical protein [Nitrosopumilus sp.]
MKIKFPSKQDDSKHRPDDNQRIDKINTIIQYGESKIKQIYKRISENEVRLESMESHSDRDYNDLLMESNEAEKEHRKDLRLFVDMLCKYKVTIK